MTFSDQWIEVNKIPTRVLTWGKHLDDDLSNVNELFLCISGNPGITKYYDLFLETVYRNTDVPVWMISHAGHEIPPKSKPNLKLPNIKLKSNEEFFNLQGQINHKVHFIKKYVPKHIKLTLIGHSVGSKIIMELLKLSGSEEDELEINKEDDNDVKNEFNKDRFQNNRLESNRFHKCYLLFPTLERIRNTPNADFLVPLLNHFMSVILFLAMIFTYFPKQVRHFLVYLTLLISRREKATPNCIDATVQLVNPKVLRHVFFLALDEMEQIKELDIETLEKNSKKLRIYFGSSDDWCPVPFYHNLVEKCPSVQSYLCCENIKHAFVLSSATVMAEKITKWYSEDHDGKKVLES